MLSDRLQLARASQHAGQTACLPLPSAVEGAGKRDLERACGDEAGW